MRLLILATLFICGGLWLFLGSLIFYEVSSRAQTTDDNLVQATFTNEQLDLLQVEQGAEVLFINSDEEPRTAPAMIVRITRGEDDEVGQLEALVTDRAAFIDLFGADGQVQTVRVERENVSPIGFIVSAAGLK